MMNTAAEIISVRPRNIVPTAPTTHGQTYNDYDSDAKGRSWAEGIFGIKNPERVMEILKRTVGNFRS